jgi:uncharacterized protein YwqG
MSYLSPALQAHLDEQIARHGLERVADDIRPLAREAIHLATAGPDDYSQVGNTRLGGVPDLPVSFKWPTIRRRRRGSQQLAFLAQLNLAELPRTRDGLFPPEGLFYFFSDSVGGHDFVRVLFHPNATQLVRVRAPQRLVPFFDDGDSDLKPHRVTPRLVVSTPDYAGYDPAAEEMWQSLRRLDLTDAYFELQKSLIGPLHGGPGQGHQILGYASGFVYKPSQAEDQVLLFEMDSDDDIGTCWSDAGLVHVLVCREDLAARRFDRVYSGIFSS